jgi:predicted PurR-regulated permease PerM
VIFILFAIIALVVLVLVPTIATAVARNVVNHLDRSPSSGNIDQSLVEARLGRIEEAIDAMATQIEKLTDQQRLLIESKGVTRDS